MKNQASSIGIIGGTEGSVEVHIDEEKIKEIENIFAEYDPILKPNRKSVPEILEYIKSRYPDEEDNSPRRELTRHLRGGSFLGNILN